MRAVFYNSCESLCSIHKTGQMCYEILKKSHHFDLEYREDQTLVEGCDLVIFNHHPVTNNWMTRDVVRSFHCLTFCIVTEIGLYTEDVAPTTPKIFDHYIILDPTIRETEYIHAFPRPLPFYNELRLQDIYPDGITIGSFGFGTYGKNWRALFEAVKKDFEKDCAMIRINVPRSTYVPDCVYNNVICEIQTASHLLDDTTNIKFELTDHVFDDKELVEWCRGNSINVFFYDREHSTGLAATTDVAIVSERPLLVSSHATFRHLHKYLTTYPTIGIKEAIGSNHAGVLQMKEDWSNDRFLEKFESIISHKKIIDIETMDPLVPILT